MSIGKFLRRHAGKITLGTLGVAAGISTGGVGIAIPGTAFGIPTAGTATIAGGAGVIAGTKIDKKRRR